MPVTIRKVDNADDFRLFFEFPWKHYANDPNWVPPLLSQRRELLDRKHNPSWEYMEGDYFIAVHGDAVVGTIVALVNHRHNEHNHENIGWFGMFETINDQAVADALLSTAVAWVRERGLNGIRGPQSFTTHEECGLLIENFSQPQILMPYNPPYYQTLIETFGLVKSMDVFSVYQDRAITARNNTLERFGKVAAHASQRSGVKIRRMDMRHKQTEFAMFKEIYNSAWDVNWGFVPFTDRELDALVKSLGQFVEPDLAFFATIDEKPVAFAMAVPNLNEALYKAYPRPGMPEIFTLLRVAWEWKIRKTIRSTRLPLMGVIPEYRNKGVDLALMHALLSAMLPLQYEYMDAGWILETNPLMSIIGKVEGKPYKTHRFYEQVWA